MRLIVKDTKEDVGVWAKDYAIKIMKEQYALADRCVLGLPTGSTPVELYKELIESYKLGEISFKDVTSFNMDEYVGLKPEDAQSYHYFMEENLFKHVDFDKKKVHILDGMAKSIKEECENYEKSIIEAGGIDLFIGGVGSDGHIAFNEPFSSLTSRTREKTLTKETIINNSRFFDDDINKVPKSALSVGIATIMDAEKVLIIANGEGKAEAIKQGIEGAISHKYTITALQMHRDTIIVCDKAAASKLDQSTIEYFKDIESK